MAAAYINNSNNGRWCWVVALASFWTNFCLLGVLRSSAVVYVALMDTFGVSREDASWPSGVFGFAMCLTGAFSGFISQYFGIRSIMMVAATFAAFSVSLCYYATCMLHIEILYGALQGIGLGMIVPLTHVILNGHFTKRRAFAMGIAYAGSSAGSFVFPVLAQIMIVEYGLRGTFLLLGGIMFNSVLGISLFRDPSNKTTAASFTESTKDNSVKLQFVLHKIECNSKELIPSRKYCLTNMDLNYTVREEESRKVSASHFVQQMDQLKCSTETYLNDEKPLKFRLNRKPLIAKLQRTIELAFEVVSHPSFLIISLAFSVYFSSSAILLMVILDHTIDLGYPQSHGVFLVSAFSFGDLVGRLGCGWIADFVQRRYLVTVYLIAMGALMMVVPVCPSYDTLMTVCIFLGVLNGCIIVNYSVILTEKFGLQKLAMAVGFSTFIIGSSAFLRPVAIGYFRDKNNSYDLLFVGLGGLQIVFTSLWFLESILSKKRPTDSSLTTLQN